MQTVTSVPHLFTLRLELFAGTNFSELVTYSTFTYNISQVLRNKVFVMIGTMLHLVHERLKKGAKLLGCS